MEDRLVFFLQRLSKYIDIILIQNENTDDVCEITSKELEIFSNFIKSDNEPYLIDKNQQHYLYQINEYIWMFSKHNDTYTIVINNKKTVWLFMALQNKTFQLNHNINIIHK